MKILFSPEYAGHVFTQASTSGVMMDTVVANTAGLVALLELRLGLHYEEVPDEVSVKIEATEAFQLAYQQRMEENNRILYVE